METAAAIQAYLQALYRKGRLHPPKFAQALGIKPGMANAILNGTRRYSMNHLDATARFLELSPVELIQRASATQTSQETQGATSDTRSTDSATGDRFPEAHHEDRAPVRRPTGTGG